MKHFVLFLGLLLPMHAAFGTAPDCRVTGVAFDASGKPLPGIVRLVDRNTHVTTYRETNDRAEFTFANLPADSSGSRYQIDLLSAPTVVTGTHIPTRSIVGRVPGFVCAAGQTARANIRIQVE